MPDILLISDERMAAHDPGMGHPERPERLLALLAHLRRHPVEHTRWSTPGPATREALQRIHPPSYVSSLLKLRGRSADLDPDTSLSPHSIDAALLAAGAAIDAAEAVMTGAATAAFALVRPPGHHAEPGRAMGFCLFNNIAVAAADARARLGAARILIADWDVHHGNGTQAAFYADPSVLFFSTHQYPFYPGTGAPTEVGEEGARGRTVNVPMPAGCADGDYAAVFERLLEPIAGDFRPDLVLVSAGFDAHRADPLGEMQLTDHGFANLCAVVNRIADRHASGRLALVLEGGYDLQAMPASARACIEVLAGAPAPTIPPADRGLQIAARARAIHQEFWPSLR